MNEWADLSPNILIIKLNVNGLYKPIKRWGLFRQIRESQL